MINYGAFFVTIFLTVNASGIKSIGINGFVISVKNEKEVEQSLYDSLKHIKSKQYAIDLFAFDLDNIDYTRIPQNVNVIYN